MKRRVGRRKEIFHLGNPVLRNISFAWVTRLSIEVRSLYDLYTKPNVQIERKGYIPFSADLFRVLINTFNCTLE